MSWSLGCRQHSIWSDELRFSPTRRPGHAGSTGDLAISVAVDADVATIHVMGSLDAGTSHDLLEIVSDLLGKGRCDVSVDLAGLDHLDQDGLWALSSIRRQTTLAGRTCTISKVPRTAERALPTAS